MKTLALILFALTLAVSGHTQTKPLVIDKLSVVMLRPTNHVQYLDDELQSVGLTVEELKTKLKSDLLFAQKQRVAITHQAPLKLQLSVQTGSSLNTNALGVVLTLRLVKYVRAEETYQESVFPLVYWEQRLTFSATKRQLRQKIDRNLTYLSRYFDSFAQGQNNEAGYNRIDPVH